METTAIVKTMEDPCVMVPAAFLALRGVEPNEVTISMSPSASFNMVKKGWQLVLLFHAFISVLDAVHLSILYLRLVVTHDLAFSIPSCVLP